MLSPARSRALVCAAVATVVLLVVVPYHVAGTPNYSVSYLFGFNNHVAIAILALFGLFVALVCPDLRFGEPREYKGKPITRTTLRRALLLTLLVSGILYVITRRLGGFDESAYLIDRLNLLLDGHQPNRDFEYAYGMSLLYAPAFLVRAFHLPVGDAYGWFWIALSLFGTWLLYKSISWIEAPSALRRHIFLFYVAISVTALLCTGVNYSLFRFVLPSFLALWIYRRMSKSASAANTAVGIFLVAPCYALLLAVSPEIAVSFAMGMLCFLCFFLANRPVVEGRGALWGALAGTVGLVALITRFAVGRGVFFTFSQFGTGGFNFPIVPAPYILLFLVAIALTAAFVSRSIRGRQPNEVMLLIFVSAAATASGLGRCDPGHVLLNPFGITLAALVIAGTGSALGRGYLIAVIAVFAVVPLPGSLSKSSVLLAKSAFPVIFAAEGPQSDSALDHFILKRMLAALGPEKGLEKFHNIRMLANLSGSIDPDHVYAVSGADGPRGAVRALR